MNHYYSDRDGTGSERTWCSLCPFDPYLRPSASCSIIIRRLITGTRADKRNAGYAFISWLLALFRLTAIRNGRKRRKATQTSGKIQIGPRVQGELFKLRTTIPLVYTAQRTNSSHALTRTVIAHLTRLLLDIENNPCWNNHQSA